MTKILMTIFTISLILISCAKETRLEPFTAGEINGTVLWARISSESNYENYSYWPDHEGINPGQAPHGVYHKIFINGDLMDALPIENKIAPIGTIIVKENINRDKDVQKITVMAKIADYNNEGGNWFWAAYSPDGEIEAEGTPRGCISCHEGMKSNDYIILRSLDHKN